MSTGTSGSGSVDNCDMSKRPSQSVLFPVVDKNTWNVSKHPWCIACDKQYHDVCLILASLLRIDPKEKTKEPKLTDLSNLFKTFEKMRLIFTAMTFGNPLTDTKNKDQYMELHKTIFKIIENILVQIFLCVNERVKQHQACTIPPQNTKETVYGNFGDLSHKHILAIYCVEFICFYVAYTQWVRLLNLRYEMFYAQNLSATLESHDNIFLKDYSDGLHLIYTIICAEFPTKSDLNKYYISDRIKIIGSNHQIIDHDDLIEYINAKLYTKECEQFPMQTVYKDCRDVVLKNIDNMEMYTSSVALGQFERHLDIFYINILSQCKDFTVATVSPLGGLHPTQSVKSSSQSQLYVRKYKEGIEVPVFKNSLKYDPDSHNKSRERRNQSRTHIDYTPGPIKTY